ncbi:MAG: LysR family transcriptional regulator [Hyphomicrobium sp.]
MDRFESISVFVTVVEAGGFSAASRHLGMPLATVSRKVSDLEDLLQVRLINRSTRRITVTEAGEAFFQSSREILESLSEAERAASGEYRTPRGGLTVTAPIVFGRLHVVPVIVEFLRTYSDVTINLQLVDRLVSLVEEHVDVAVRIGKLPDSSMVAARIGSIRLVVCGTPQYLSLRGQPKRPADLLSHDCITVTNLPMNSKWRFKSGRSTSLQPVRSRFSVTTAEAGIDAALAGAGLTQVRCYQVVEAINDGRLKRVLRDYETEPVPLSLVHRSARLTPLKLRAFLDFAVPRIKARLQAI